MSRGMILIIGLSGPLIGDRRLTTQNFNAFDRWVFIDFYEIDIQRTVNDIHKKSFNLGDIDLRAIKRWAIIIQHILILDFNIENSVIARIGIFVRPVFIEQ